MKPIHPGMLAFALAMILCGCTQAQMQAQQMPQEPLETMCRLPYELRNCRMPENLMSLAAAMARISHCNVAAKPDFDVG